MKFNYQTRDKTGQVQAGVIEAASKEAALNLLQRHGFFVTFLEEAEPPIYAREIKLFKRTSRKDVVLFSRQLSIMFKSKIPLVEALQTLSSQAKNPDFKEKILKISDEVEGGVLFSKALAKYPNIFNHFYISMVKSGEAAGKLSDVLDYLAEHLEREYYLVSKIKGAMIYPALVLSVVVMVLLIMAFFVIPQFAQILQGVEQDLPAATKIVIAASAFVREKILMIALASAALFFFLWRYAKTKEGAKVLDKIALKLPLIGPFLQMFYLSRFAENLSTLVAGGLPIARSLEITGDIVGSPVYRRVILKTRDEVRKGEQICSVLKEYPEIFPPIFSQMVSVGEKTGTLDKTLLNIVGFYQKEVERTIDNLMSILEPIMIIFLGSIVMVVMFSVLVPLYQMTNVV